HTASEGDVRWNAFTISAGVSDAPRPCDSELLTRSDLPIISILPGASSSRTLWLKRKLRTGYWILPFSIYQSPSRVRPVNRAVRGSTPRMYQKRLTNKPRCIDLIICSTVAGGAELSRMEFTGPGVACLPFSLAQNLE